MLTAAGVEEREVKLEGVLLQALKKLILRVGRAGAEKGMLWRAMARALAVASGAA